MDQKVLGESTRYASRIAHVKEGWISPLLQAVRATDYAAAKWKAAPSVASIWEILAHALPYTERLLARATGTSTSDAEDWPDVTDTSEAAWKDFSSRAESIIVRLQEAIDELSDEQLVTPPHGRDVPLGFIIVDIAVHDAYHAGQIVKLQQLFAAARVGASV